MEEGTYLEAVARNLMQSRFLYRVDVIARVEAEDDINFWRGVIHNARPTVKVKFIPSEVTSGVRHQGKSICLKYKNYLNSHFVICVDSDFDNFTRSGFLTPSQFMLQTYTYSWENHHCVASNLQAKLNSLSQPDFDFEYFISRLSRMIYPALCGIIAARRLKASAWTLDSLCSELKSVQVNRPGLFDRNGDALLKLMDLSVSSWMSGQSKLPDYDETEFYESLKSAGLTPDTAYLYMQGHCIYDILLRMGNVLTEGKHHFGTEVMAASLQYSGYPEMEHIKSDVMTVLR